MGNGYYFVYILTNRSNKVLYTGITNNLERRVAEHKRKINPRSFSTRYNLAKLVFFEYFETPGAAIAREKQIKGGPRRRKKELIESMNPGWRDLAEDF